MKKTFPITRKDAAIVLTIFEDNVSLREQLRQATVVPSTEADLMAAEIARLRAENEKLLSMLMDQAQKSAFVFGALEHAQEALEDAVAIIVSVGADAELQTFTLIKVEEVLKMFPKDA